MLMLSRELLTLTSLGGLGWTVDRQQFFLGSNGNFHTRLFWNEREQSLIVELYNTWTEAKRTSIHAHTYTHTHTKTDRQTRRLRETHTHTHTDTDTHTRFLLTTYFVQLVGKGFVHSSQMNCRIVNWIYGTTWHSYSGWIHSGSRFQASQTGIQNVAHR